MGRRVLIAEFAMCFGKRVVLLFLFGWFCFAGLAHAQNRYVLYQTSNFGDTLLKPITYPVYNYDEILAHLVPGDRLVFPNGVEMEFRKKLSSEGRGNTTFVFLNEKNEAVRIPKKSGPFDSLYFYIDFIEMFKVGSYILNGYGIPAVQVIESEKYYLRVEYLDVHFTLREYLENKIPELAPEALIFVRDELMKFAASCWQVEQIGDFSLYQLAFDGKRWVLLDFTGMTSGISSKLSTQTPFDQKNFKSVDYPWMNSTHFEVLNQMRNEALFARARGGSLKPSKSKAPDLAAPRFIYKNCAWEFSQI